MKFGDWRYNSCNLFIILNDDKIALLDKCERESCLHDATDHPNNGACMKCGCVGFFRNSQVRDPLQNKYIQHIIDIKTRFDTTLDMADHLNENFPKMAKEFFVAQDKKNDEFYKKLHDYDLLTWIQLKQVLDNYNKIGRIALDGASQGYWSNCLHDA